MVGSVEDVKTDDVTFEEPKVIVTQEEEEEGEERLYDNMMNAIYVQCYIYIYII